MHMQSGIGRAGWRLLSLSTLAIGALGLAVVWAAAVAGASIAFEIGLVVIAAALVGLTLFTFVLSHGEGRARSRASLRERRAALKADRAEERAARRRRKGKAADDVDYDFPGASGAAIDVVGAAPQGALEFQAVPAAPQAVRDPRAWPDRPRGRPALAPSAGNAPAWHEEPPRRRELAQKYTATTPMLRGILTGDAGTAVYEEIPEVTAELPGPGIRPDRLPDGTVRGRCGQCGTVLLAPSARPVRLRCPRCDKTTMLRG